MSPAPVFIPNPPQFHNRRDAARKVKRAVADTPPAMTPAPSGAGLSSTRPPSHAPVTSCGMVLPFMVTVISDEAFKKEMADDGV